MMKFSPCMVNKPQKVKINWYTLKWSLSELVNDMENEIRFRDRGNIKFSGYYPHGFVYDLGHAGRGYQDFPRVIELDAANIVTDSSPDSDCPVQEATMDACDFFSQLNANILDYVKTDKKASEFRRNHPGACYYVGYVAFLQKIGQALQGKSMTFKFDFVSEDNQVYSVDHFVMRDRLYKAP